MEVVERLEESQSVKEDLPKRKIPVKDAFFKALAFFFFLNLDV